MCTLRNSEGESGDISERGGLGNFRYHNFCTVNVCLNKCSDNFIRLTQSASHFRYNYSIFYPMRELSGRGFTLSFLWKLTPKLLKRRVIYSTESPTCFWGQSFKLFTFQYNLTGEEWSQIKCSIGTTLLQLHIFPLKIVIILSSKILWEIFLYIFKEFLGLSCNKIHYRMNIMHSI